MENVLALLIFNEETDCVDLVINTNNSVTNESSDIKELLKGFLEKMIAESN